MQDISYILNVLGEDREQYYNAVTPPIVQTSNFAFKTVQDFRLAIKDELSAHLYSRGNNPTVEILRKKIAALEACDDCLVFSSGVAAITSGILAFVQTGQHIICVESPYSWTAHVLKENMRSFGVESSFVDGRNIQAIADAIRPETGMIILESPNTFYFDLQDIQAVCALAKEKGIMTLIDNSYCTPLHQQPHVLGVDLVCHTATKYLSGHSDVVAGVVCGSEEHIRTIFNKVFMVFGAIPSPHDAWLFLRGLRTLPLRLEKSTDNAEKIIAFLEKHPKVERILYPFHASHKQYELAQKQMRRGSGLFAIVLKTDDAKKVEAFCDRLQRFLLAVSWGGHESLVFPAILKEGSDYPLGYVRFYAGLEEADVLISDIEQSLEVV